MVAINLSYSSFEPVITYSINQSNAVTAVSESLKSDTYLNFPNVKKKIDVIPNFICLDEFDLTDEKHLKSLYAPNGERIIIHISNFNAIL